MKMFTYYIEHTVGIASGTIIAKSEEVAKQQLQKQYTATHKDDVANTVEVKVTKLELTLVGEAA